MQADGFQELPKSCQNVDVACVLERCPEITRKFLHRSVNVGQARANFGHIQTNSADVAWMLNRSELGQIRAGCWPGLATTWPSSPLRQLRPKSHQPGRNRARHLWIARNRLTGAQHLATRRFEEQQVTNAQLSGDFHGVRKRHVQTMFVGHLPRRLRLHLESTALH